MIKLGLIGTGGIAKMHIHRLKVLSRFRIVAVADVDLVKARQFAHEHGIPAAYATQRELLDKEAVDAVINITPDTWHAPLTLEALAAGKHVLCEKPLALNARDARRMADAAERAGLVNLVNFTYRNSAALQGMSKVVQRGDIGRPIHFEARYLQSWLSSRVWGDWRKEPRYLWRLATKHGSKGVLGDVGVHILDFVSLPLGRYAAISCRLKNFAKAPDNRMGDYTLDANDSAVMYAEMENGALGVIHTTRWATGHTNSLSLSIHGDEGAVRIDLDKDPSRMEVCKGKNVHTVQWRSVRCAKVPIIHERFLRQIRTGKPQQPDFRQGAAIQQVLDLCFRSDRTGKLQTVKA